MSVSLTDKLQIGRMRAHHVTILRIMVACCCTRVTLRGNIVHGGEGSVIKIAFNRASVPLVYTSSVSLHAKEEFPSLRLLVNFILLSLNILRYISIAIYVRKGRFGQIIREVEFVNVDNCYTRNVMVVK